MTIRSFRLLCPSKWMMRLYGLLQQDEHLTEQC
nr:MAG TPA_asm: hypothetical protein [Caudoviricetes sp.]DAV84936.1 MAG TPA: hypothetical protein [Bacteriophage sp.]